MYLDGYVIEPEALTWAEYDAERDAVATGDPGFGTSVDRLFLDEVTVLDDVTVRVRIKHVFDGQPYFMLVTARITETGAKFVSCTAD